jgi:acyl CoA:acetate/3-ketoacid CoA transferase alpha subunit
MPDPQPLPGAIRAHVHPGAVVALEGFTHLIPYAAGHEIVRQGITGLTLMRPDKHIGRRSVRLPADPVRALQDAMAAILGRGGAA